MSDKRLDRRIARARNRAVKAQQEFNAITQKIEKTEIYEKAVAPVFKEFKAFIARGNVIDLAVGVIMGAAFGKITGSLVNDIVMPFVGVILGGVDFTTLSVTVQGVAGEVAINYGLFIQAVVDFLIIALTVFILVKALTARRKKPAAAPPPPPPEPSKEELLLAEIRDLLKEKNNA